MVITEEKIRHWLKEVRDPEIPVLSLMDMGIITNIKVSSDGKVIVDMTPTFAGCPAIDYMKNDVIRVLEKNGVENPKVNVSFKTQWNSNMISEKGRKALKDFGLTPPPKHNLQIELDIIKDAQCPYCGSKDTKMKSPFGPTLCRSLHYCNNCKEAFQQFKPV